jgi:hypothetical protein
VQGCGLPIWHAQRLGEGQDRGMEGQQKPFNAQIKAAGPTEEGMLGRAAGRRAPPHDLDGGVRDLYWRRKGESVARPQEGGYTENPGLRRYCRRDRVDVDVEVGTSCSTYSAVSASLGTTPRGWSRGANNVILPDMTQHPPAPTLDQLRRHSPWCWVVCETCMHRKPVAFTPWIIRWGPEASSNLLRQSARCGRCGGKGAALQHQSWGGSPIGVRAVPILAVT